MEEQKPVTSIEVLAVDLDDTIVRTDKTISTNTLESLAAWEASGGRVVIATGRPPRMTRAIPDSLHHLPWICYNGAVIHHGDEVLYENLIAGTDTQQIVRAILTASPDVRLGLEIDDVLYINQPTDRPGAQHVADLLSVAGRPAAKLLLSLQEYEVVEQVMKALPQEAKVLRSPKYNLAQIMPYNTSKELALRHLLEHWGLTMEHVVAFGDDVNDVEMVRAAGLGIAMDNAVPEVKQVADRITASNDEEGVAIVVTELLRARNEEQNQ